MAAAALRAGRQPGEIALMAVSKTMPADRIREAFEAGQRLFGENRVQEFQSKHAELSAASPTDCLSRRLRGVQHRARALSSHRASAIEQGRQGR